MAVLSMTPTKKLYQTTTVIANELITPEFDMSASVQASGVANNTESTQKYLAAIGAHDIDKQFNDLVSQYESQYDLIASGLESSFNEQVGMLQQQLNKDTTELWKESNIGLQDSLMRAGEGVLGKLGTGAAADLTGDTTRLANQAAEASKLALESQYGDVVSQLESDYNKTLDSLNKEYTNAITSAEDMYNETLNQVLATLPEYQENVELFGKALFELMAQNAGVTFNNEVEMRKGLEQLGLIEQAGDTTNFTVTAKGQEVIAHLMTSPGAGYGDHSSNIDKLTDAMAERVMQEKYPSINPVDNEETYTDKKLELKIAFDEWLAENATIMYYTDLNLATMENGQLKLAPVLSSTISDYAKSVATSDFLEAHAGDGVSIWATGDVGELFGVSYKRDKKQDKLEAYQEDIISKLRNGEIASGTYIAATNQGNDKNTKLFYYENGKLYETEYTLKNLPDKMTPQSLIGLTYIYHGQKEKDDNPTVTNETNVILEYNGKDIDYELNTLISSFADNKLPDGSLRVKFTFGNIKQWYVYNSATGMLETSSGTKSWKNENDVTLRDAYDYQKSLEE